MDVAKHWLCVISVTSTALYKKWESIHCIRLSITILLTGYPHNDELQKQDTFAINMTLK